MWLLIAGLIRGFWLYNIGLRLEAEDSPATVRVYIDGKRMDAYLKED